MCEFKHHAHVTMCDIPPFFHQPPQPPHNDAADDSHHTAPNAHNEVQRTPPPTNANGRSRTQTTAHEPKRPPTDENDHAESRCHAADGDVVTKRRTTTLVVVRRFSLVSHGTLVPTSPTDNQTTNDICRRSGPRDDNTGGRHGDHGTTTRQERGTTTRQHATAKPRDDAQRRRRDNTRRQRRGTTMRCQHRTTTDRPHAGLRLTTPFSVPLPINTPIPILFPSTSSPSLQHPPLPLNIPPSLQHPPPFPSKPLFPYPSSLTIPLALNILPPPPLPFLTSPSLTILLPVNVPHPLEILVVQCI